MKSTGMVRKIDELGRVVIPIEIRRTMNLNVKDPLEIFTDEDAIVLKSIPLAWFVTLPENFLLITRNLWTVN